MLCSSELLAQETVQLNGVVLRKDSLSPVSFVNVVNLSTSKGTSANHSGEFALNVHLGDTIVFTAIGYSDLKWIAVEPLDKKWNFKMKSLQYQLGEIDIFGFNYNAFEARKPRLSRKGIQIEGSPRSDADFSDYQPTILSPISLLYNQFSRTERLKREGWEFVQKMERLKYLDKIFEDQSLMNVLKLDVDELESFKLFIVNNLSVVPSVEDYGSLIYLRRAALQFKVRHIKPDIR